MPIGNQDDPIYAMFLDQSGRTPKPYRQLKPLLVTKAEIDAEIERLASGPFRGSRSCQIINPGLMATRSLYPAVSVSLNVLLPGERTRPHRHNSSVVNFALQGSGSSIIGGRTIKWGQHDTWSTPPWMVHQHVNDSDDIDVRLSYSNSGLLDLLGVHVFEDAEDLDPNQPMGNPIAELEMSQRGEVIGEDGAAVLTYEQLISPEPPYQPPLHWPYPLIHERLQALRALGQEYKGRRLFLMYDRSTGRSQGTTSTFFATITMRPAGIVDEPHRHTSGGGRLHSFNGRGWSVVGGRRYMVAGDLMLTAPVR